MSDGEELVVRLGDYLSARLWDEVSGYDLAQNVCNWLITETPYVQSSRDFLAMVFMTRHQAECSGHNDQCFFTDLVAEGEADQMLANMQKNHFALIRLPATDTPG